MMSEAAMTTIDRPLGLGEVLAETVELYGRRIWALVGTGAVLAASIVAASVVPVGIDLVLVALGLVGCYAAAARIAAGDSFAEAWSQVIVRLPVLLLLGRVLGAALVGFAENGGFVAFLIVQALLGPFFFLGLSVLYFEQTARALSSPREQR